MDTPARAWDLFCHVVDNLGDIGVCWRLARQLAREHRIEVRLWVDNLASFRSLCPALDPSAAVQRLGGVEVHRWSDSFPEMTPGAVVLEAFGCRLPASFVEAMARQERPPVWINLEHLSAESWVEGCHGLPSPHPGLPLVTHFFFPGFGERTGGLLREADLLARRDAFAADARRVADFWGGIGVPPPAPGDITVSLFGYPGAPYARLFDAWSRGPVELRVIVPRSGVEAALAGYFGSAAESPRPLRRGRLEVWPIAFLDQDHYDELLWACAVNFVRGEDSFVRAQWAAGAFVWQAYPQSDGAHLGKMEAFLTRYSAGLDPAAADALGALWREWNAGGRPDAAWDDFLARLEPLVAHGRRWAERLAHRDDLAKNLVAYTESLL
ncbi:MAG: elongation factor P maturation arginine rhamnosyltransferase EarP [Rhodocyclales bacterium CG_4_9_14_3_um_filter_68_10]|nr:MAG: elongation factor P maturation arginine rhamnosyltransferase EarP [Rhodocyclales bacterium CG_4_9_14_3_um_filter_68_10]